MSSPTNRKELEKVRKELQQVTSRAIDEIEKLQGQVDSLTTQLAERPPPPPVEEALRAREEELQRREAELFERAREEDGKLGRREAKLLEREITGAAGAAAAAAAALLAALLAGLESTCIFILVIIVIAFCYLVYVGGHIICKRPNFEDLLKDKVTNATPLPAIIPPPHTICTHSRSSPTAGPPPHAPLVAARRDTPSPAPHAPARHPRFHRPPPPARHHSSPLSPPRPLAPPILSPGASQ